MGHDATGGPRTRGIPGLSEAQAEALDTLHVIGRRHELITSMEPGDIRFVNNMGLMHRREVYSDVKTGDVGTLGIDRLQIHEQGGDNGGERQMRHLMRLWLHNPQKCWALPPALELAWRRVYGDSDRVERWDLLVVDQEGKVWSKPIWQDDQEQDDGEIPEPRVETCLSCNSVRLRLPESVHTTHFSSACLQPIQHHTSAKASRTHCRNPCSSECPSIDALWQGSKRMLASENSRVSIEYDALSSGRRFAVSVMNPI